MLNRDQLSDRRKPKMKPDATLSLGSQLISILSNIVIIARIIEAERIAAILEESGFEPFQAFQMQVSNDWI
jgi:hypothetical protein